MTEALALDDGVEYPTSDGRPVAETPLHYRRLADAAHALNMRFESHPGSYVGVNMLVYDQRGKPTRHLSPDIFVSFGVADREPEREIYKLWEDPSPAFVLELTSKTTRDEDRRKKARYARWGVAEYFLYDPRGEYTRPPLKGFEFTGSGYRAMAPEILANGNLGFPSKALGLGLWLDRSVLRFYDPETARNLSTPREAESRAAAATVRAGVAGAKAADAESRAADAESRAAHAESRAAAEAARRRALEAEIAELKSR